jgi:mRNA-capping enzyme
MDGVPGVKAILDATKIHELQSKLHGMCNWECPSCDCCGFKHGFPGCHPSAMDTKNMWKLTETPYRVGWKADGTRYMMLIVGKGEVYLFDRGNNIFLATQLSFPQSSQLVEHIQNTLVDGEMVTGKDGDYTTPTFLLFDIVSFEVQYTYLQ